MPVAITDYTTYAEVRAVLGVSVDEIDDATLALDIYAHSLVAELEDVSVNLPADFDAILEIGDDERTAVQTRFYNAVRLFAAYCVGNQLASSLPLFSPKSLTDGKAGFARHSDSPYKHAIEECRAAYERYLDRLKSRYAELTSSSSSAPLRPFMAASSPTSDPVTG